jgi:geranylgeranyl transferase type-2 subunit beta
MTEKANSRVLFFTPLAATMALLAYPLAASAEPPSPAEVLDGVRSFFNKTARPEGSFRPGIDPEYEGMSDCAYSDLAAPTYAVVLHKTFGWKLPHESKTRDFFLSRQNEDGAFVNVRGTVDPESAPGRVYNTTQALVALHALGAKPQHDPLPVFAEVLKGDYETLPAYSTSFFPLAYQAYGKPFPPEADRKLRATMIQADNGYLNDHIAATFHAVHYNRLLGAPTAKAEAMVARVLRDQKPDGSWLLNQPARDRHATFDAVFVLRQLGKDRPECRRAIAKAAAWSLTCRNADGGFGHFPGSTSDADAVYFHVGTLVMAGVLKPAAPTPKDSHLLGWGHLFPPP